MEMLKGERYFDVHFSQPEPQGIPVGSSFFHPSGQDQDDYQNRFSATIR